MTLIVCSLETLTETIADRRPSHVISLLEPNLMIAPLEGVNAHLRLSLHDIVGRMPGMTVPDASSVTKLIEFARGWDQSAPMIVHCLAGVSRSTASALVVACDRNPDVPELEIAKALRRVSPHARPNARIISLADELLGRRGRLIAAVARMGRENLDAYRVPFDLPTSFSAGAAIP